MNESGRFDPDAPPPSFLAAALACRCPRCGGGKLFEGLLTVAPLCPACGLDFGGEDSGDGPVALVVLLLGAIVVLLALLLEIAMAPPLWLQIVIWTPVIVGGSILLLRPFKAGLIALQYRHRALGGGV